MNELAVACRSHEPDEKTNERNGDMTWHAFDVVVVQKEHDTNDGRTSSLDVIHETRM